MCINASGISLEYSDSKQMRILIVEDDTRIAGLVAKGLRESSNAAGLFEIPDQDGVAGGVAAGEVEAFSVA